MISTYSNVHSCLYSVFNKVYLGWGNVHPILEMYLKCVRFQPTNLYPRTHVDARIPSYRLGED